MHQPSRETFNIVTFEEIVARSEISVAIKFTSGIPLRVVYAYCETPTELPYLKVLIVERVFHSIRKTI